MPISTALMAMELSLFRPGTGIRLVPLQRTREGGKLTLQGYVQQVPWPQHSALSREVLQLLPFLPAHRSSGEEGLDEILTTCRTHGITYQLDRETIGEVHTLSDSGREQVHKKNELGSR